VPTKKGMYVLQSEVEKAVKEVRDKRLQKMITYLDMYSNSLEELVLE
jgi:hypothetical protein